MQDLKYLRLHFYYTLEHFYLCCIEDDDEKYDMNYQIRAKMGHLVRRARKAIPVDDSLKEKIHKLLQLVYGDWGFHCDEKNYFQAKNLLLPSVLDSKEGMPVTLGCIVLYLADKLSLPVYPVIFPTQLVLRADVDDETAFINPWNGEYVSQEELQKWYEGAMGFGAKMTADDLAIADSERLNERFADLAKQCLIRENFCEIALRYINSRLITRENDPYERRDRALVLIQMEAYHAALEDLEFFIEKCPDDPTALLLAPKIPELIKEADLNNLYMN